MWHSCQNICNADNRAFHDRGGNSPIYGGADRIGDFSHQAFAGIPEQAARGGPCVVCQVCAVAKHQEQCDQRNQK